MSMIYKQIIHKAPVEKGWSGDQKYCATTIEGTKYLLRISPIDKLERKRREYEKMKEVACLGIPMCVPIEFGICEEGVYAIQSWIEGADAEEAIMNMTPPVQYRYGRDAGSILAKIHTIPAPADAPDWETRFNAKIDRVHLLQYPKFAPLGDPLRGEGNPCYARASCAGFGVVR